MKKWNTKSSKKSLMNQMLFRMSSVIIMSILLIGIMFQNIKGIIIKKYSDSAQQSVKIAADNIDYLLENISNISNSILSNHELIDYLETGQEGLFLESLNSYYISNFYVEGIYTETNIGYCFVGANIVEGKSMFEENTLKDTSGEVIWFPSEAQQIQLLTGRQEKQMLMVGRKIIDVSSLKELGYLKIAIDESLLKEFYNTLENDGSKVMIFNKEGRIISSTDNDYNRISEEEHPYLKSILASSIAGYVEYEEDQISYVAIYSGLNNGNWRMIKEVPKKVLYAEINKIQDIVFFVSILFLVIMFFISYVYSKKVTAPLKKMIGQMKEVEAGNLNAMVEINTNRELHELGENFNHMVYRVKRLMNEVVETERNKNELELEVLHAQINPHFLYNTLNTIRWMAKLKGEDTISKAIVALVKLLRISISVDKNMITVKEEIAYVESYLLIQRLRFNHKFEMEYHIQPEVGNHMIPKLILQPIVENSLIYGIDEADGESELLKIRIYSTEMEGETCIIVEDNGVGMEEETLMRILRDEKNVNKFSKVGLNNVNQRIKMFFGESYGIRIISRKGEGTKVVIPIPSEAEKKI